MGDFRDKIIKNIATSETEKQEQVKEEAAQIERVAALKLDVVSLLQEYNISTVRLWEPTVVGQIYIPSEPSKWAWRTGKKMTDPYYRDIIKYIETKEAWLLFRSFTYDGSYYETSNLGITTDGELFNFRDVYGSESVAGETLPSNSFSPKYISSLVANESILSSGYFEKVITDRISQNDMVIYGIGH